MAATDIRLARVRNWDSDGPVMVGIEDYGYDGNRETEIPTILVERGAHWSMRLTWEEAKELAQALLDVTAVAENG